MAAQETRVRVSLPHAPGTAPHGLFLLVVAEVITLIYLRRVFRSAHGG